MQCPHSGLTLTQCQLESHRPCHCGPYNPLYHSHLELGAGPHCLGWISPHCTKSVEGFFFTIRAKYRKRQDQNRETTAEFSQKNYNSEASSLEVNEPGTLYRLHKKKIGHKINKLETP